jgi:transposase-like protein
MEKVRDGGRVVNKALVIAHGVHETGRREILSIDVGEAETEAFWTAFLRGLVKRGLVGVQLAISDAHAGLKAAIAKVLGCAWQRCTVHFLRDCFGHAGKDQHGLLGALIRPIFAADGLGQARDRLSEAVAHLDGRLEDRDAARRRRSRHPRLLRVPALALAQAALDEPARALQQRSRPTHRRRRHLPDNRSLIRLAGMLCIEQNDEWLVGRGYLSAESISLVLAGPDDHTHRRSTRRYQAPSGVSCRDPHRRSPRTATPRPGT